ncbi:MAG TPA: hypothetical protein VK186_24205 [Candidatus Deferrimicrobium sp.]|nr:hypothetical protein [Candidatus Deferrimicrobium sp.]
MAASNKLKTSQMAVCLKAIKDYVDMDEAKVTKAEQNQIKAKAKIAVEQLPTLCSIETQDAPVNGCKLTQIALGSQDFLMNACASKKPAMGGY